MLVLFPNNCLWTYMGERLGAGRCFFCPGGNCRRLWVLLIFCNIETLFIPRKQSELPLMLPYHWFLFPAKIMHSIMHLGEVLFCHPVKCYPLSLMLEQVKSVYYDMDQSPVEILQRQHLPFEK